MTAVIPTHNRSTLLERAIRSVVGQSFRGWELIIVDDASTDNTAIVLEAWTARDPRIHVLRNHRSCGAACARNLAIAAARGELIAFLDDDDEWLPAKLEHQLSVLDARPAGVGLCYSPYVYIEAGGRQRVVGTLDARGHHVRLLLLERNFLGTQTVIVRRDLIQRAGGFDTALPPLEDWDLWLRLSSLTEFAYLPTVTARVYATAGSISGQRDLLTRASLAMLSKLTQQSPISDDELAALQYALGHVLISKGSFADGRKLLLAGAFTRPSSRRVAMAVAVMLGPGAYGLFTGLHAYASSAIWRVRHRTDD